MGRGGGGRFDRSTGGGDMACTLLPLTPGLCSLVSFRALGE